MKKKLLLTSILSVIMCMSLIVGATFALFTSQDQVNVAITSGKVNVTAEFVVGSVATKQLYDTDYTAGKDNMYQGTVVFTDNNKSLSLSNLVPGDAVKFQIKVVNGSTVDVQYRTIVSCDNNGGLFKGLAVSIAGISTNYNGNMYTTNWAIMPAGEQYIDVEISLPDAEDNNKYQDKSCSISYKVEAVQGNAKTENVSTGVEVNGANEDVVLKTNGATSPEVEVPAELLNGLANEVQEVAFMHSEPKVDATNNTVTIETMELVDENGDVIDLETLNNDKPITVKFNVGNAFNEGETVIVYHDSEAIATAVVDADKNITYTTTHFCEVKVAFGDGKIDSIIELKNAFDKAQNGDTILFGGDITSVEGILIDSKNLTVDLNGYTYTVTDGANVNSRAFKIIGSANVTVKNGTIIAEGDKNSGAYGSIRTEGSAKVTLDSLVLKNSRGGGLNVKVCAGTEVTINNCEIYAQYGGGVEASGGNVILNNTKIDQKGVYGNAWWSEALNINGGGKITVNSGEYSGQAIETDSNASMGNCVAFILSSGGTLDIYGGTFKAKVSEVSNHSNFLGIVYADNSAIVNIYGGAFISNGAILDMRSNNASLPAPAATIYGGAFSSDPAVSGLYASNLITIAEGANISTIVSDIDAIKALFKNGGNASVGTDLTIEDFDPIFGESIKAGITVDFMGNKVVRETSGGNALYVYATDKVTLNNAQFESVKGSAVIDVRKDGANIEINNSTFKNYAEPSTGNVAIKVLAPNTTIVFNNCEFYNMPISIDYSAKENVKVVFNNCKFDWTGANCPGYVKVGNITNVSIDLNDCEINYTAPKGDNFVDYNNPKNIVINANNVVFNVNVESAGSLKVGCNIAKTTYNLSDNCVYLLNGVEVDINEHLGY